MHIHYYYIKLLVACMILVIITIFAMINHGVDDCKESVSALAYRRGGANYSQSICQYMIMSAVGSYVVSLTIGLRAYAGMR